MLLIEAAVVFGAAGRLDWVWAWVFLAIYLVSIAVNAALLRKSPEIVAERGQPAEFKRCDKVVSGLWSLLQFIGLPLVASLDARFAWTGVVAAGRGHKWLPHFAQSTPDTVWTHTASRPSRRKRAG